MNYVQGRDTVTPGLTTVCHREKPTYSRLLPVELRFGTAVPVNVGKITVDNGMPTVYADGRRFNNDSVMITTVMSLLCICYHVSQGLFSLYFRG